MKSIPCKDLVLTRTSRIRSATWRRRTCCSPVCLCRASLRPTRPESCSCRVSTGGSTCSRRGGMWSLGGRPPLGPPRPRSRGTDSRRSCSWRTCNTNARSASKDLKSPLTTRPKLRCSPWSRRGSRPGRCSAWVRLAEIWRPRRRRGPDWWRGRAPRSGCCKLQDGVGSRPAILTSRSSGGRTRIPSTPGKSRPASWGPTLGTLERERRFDFCPFKEDWLV